MTAVTSKAPATPAVSERAKAPGKTGCLRVFFFIFFAAGALTCWFITVKPLLQIRAARSWDIVPCTVLSSSVASHDGDDSTTYSVKISYRYEVDGRGFQGSRYRFEAGSDSNRMEKQEIVRRHPAGAQTDCFVNPANPNEAVIDRNPHRGLWWGAMGLLFVAVGGAGMMFAPRLSGGATRAVPLPSSGSSGPVELKPKHTPLVKFFGVLALAIFLNAFIGVFFYLVFLADDADRVPFFAKAIVSLFSLLAVAMIGGVFYSFLALFNPRLRLTTSSAEIPLGGMLQLDWQIDGRADKFTRLRILLEGREEATYGRGTDTTTDTHVFCEIPVIESTDRAGFRSGTARIAVPADSMHTFVAPNNKVLWHLRVDGVIPRFPDVKDEYPVTILPAS